MGTPRGGDDYRRRLAASGSVFACLDWLPEAVLDEASDEVAQGHPAQRGPDLERAVDVVGKVDRRPHMSTIVSLCVYVKEKTIHPCECRARSINSVIEFIG
jgi:hypothetical protein